MDTDRQTLEQRIAEFGPPLVRVVMMPKDTNSHGNIFGGVILSYLDLAAGEEAVRVARGPCVTAVVREVEFIAPVSVADHVSFHTQTTRIGRTSITVDVMVVAYRGRERECPILVTEAEVVMVAVDDQGKPRPLDECALTRK